MYSSFGEAFKQLILKTSYLLNSVVSSDFKLLSIYKSELQQELMVSFYFNGHAVEETYHDFANSYLLQFLSAKQIRELIDLYTKEQIS